MTSFPDSPSTAYSDSDSEWSSLERQRVAEILGKNSNKKGMSHKRTRKKRAAIPVATPKVPMLSNMGAGQDGIVGLNYNSMKEDKNHWRMESTERGV